MLKRTIDILASLVALALLALPMLLIGLWVRFDSPGPALHWSKRFGADGKLFAMPKFRSMHAGTPSVPTHMLTDAHNHLTRAGRILRRTSLDELPQLWSVLAGDMSLVGPRPALFSQDDLMAMRREAGVAGMRPGITGWAQINGRDELTLEQKVALEREYRARASLFEDLRILWLTVLKGSQGISH